MPAMFGIHGGLPSGRRFGRGKQPVLFDCRNFANCAIASRQQRFATGCAAVPSNFYWFGRAAAGAGRFPRAALNQASPMRRRRRSKRSRKREFMGGSKKLRSLDMFAASGARERIMLRDLTKKKLPSKRISA